MKISIKLETLLNKFKELYPDPKSELDYKNNFQLVVAVILSAQCTDKKVNQITPILFKTFPTFQKLSEAKINELEEIIRPINYYKSKSKNLISMGNQVCERHSGKLPLEFEALTELSGVGRKTANVVLSELDIKPALAVDTHVFRLSRRLGLSNGANVLEVEKELTTKFPPESWKQLHHSLILHGRRICKAQNPNCTSCELKSFCKFYKDNEK